MFQLIARHLLHTLNVIVVESFTTPHHYCPICVQPLSVLTVTEKELATGENRHLSTTGLNNANGKLYATDILRNALNANRKFSLKGVAEESTMPAPPVPTHHTLQKFLLL